MKQFVRWLRDGVTAFAILALIWLVAAKINGPDGAVRSGQFVAVDGDTLSLAGERLRLEGIDAPELAQLCRRAGADWSCGKVAREMLRSLLQAGSAQCRGGGRDRYCRLLVSCRVNDVEIGREMVRRGMAISYGRYGREEKEARDARSGLWAGEFERPQDWRRQQGLAGESTVRRSLSGMLKGMIGIE